MVAPPSMHASGKRYKWVVSIDKMVEPSAHLWNKLNERKPSKTVSNPTTFRKSSRNNSLTRVAGSLRHYGLDFTTILSCLKKVNKSACEPPLDEREVESIANSISRYSISDDEYFENMENVQPRSVEFLQKPYFPLGCLSVIDGDPGVGKSYLTASLASAVSRGAKWAGEPIGNPRKVLFLSIEDDADRVLLPRLLRQNADISKIDFMSKAFCLDEGGVDRLRRKISQGDFGLLIIDPITAFMPAEADMYRANEVRGFLIPLAEMAREFNLAIVIIRHLRKADTESALHRGIGSIDFIAAVRSAMILAKSPDDENARVFAHTKASYTRLGPSQNFLMEGEEGEIAKMVWEGVSDLDAETLLKSQNQKPAKSEEAENFLRDMLSGGPVLASTIKTQGEARSFSETTLKRARRALGVKTTGGPNAELSLP